MEFLRLWEVCIIDLDDDGEEYSYEFENEAEALKFVIKCLKHESNTKIYTLSPDFVSTCYR